MYSSDEEYEEEIAAALVCSEKHMNRKVWIHEINLNRQRDGEYHTLIKILEKEENSDRFYMYFRMKKDQFDYLHNLLENRIRKADTKFRLAISTRERLAVCLRQV